MNTPLCQEDFGADPGQCLARLHELGASDIIDLTRFAQWRLNSFGAASVPGEDLAQGALQLVVAGAQTKNGRKPRREDVVDRHTFRKYLGGVVCSKAEAISRPRPLAFVALDAILAERLPSRQLTPAQYAELSDLKEVLFLNLRQCAPGRLLPTINAWESVFLTSDRIPSINGYRKYVSEVRKLARQIMLKLGWISREINKCDES